MTHAKRTGPRGAAGDGRGADWPSGRCGMRKEEEEEEEEGEGEEEEEGEGDAAAPRRDGGGGRGPLQPQGGPGRLPQVRDGAAGGAAGALPERLAGAHPLPAEPGRRLLVHLQGRRGQGGSAGRSPAAARLRVAAVAGAARAGGGAGGAAGPLRFRLPHGAAAAPRPALAAAVPGGAALGGAAHLRALHRRLQRLAGPAPPLGCPQGGHRGFLRAALPGCLPGDHERGLARGGRGHAGRGHPLHRRCLQHHPGALHSAQAARPALMAENDIFAQATHSVRGYFHFFFPARRWKVSQTIPLYKRGPLIFSHFSVLTLHL